LMEVSVNCVPTSGSTVWEGDIWLGHQVGIGYSIYSMPYRWLDPVFKTS
jgi:hypothetical protein